MFSFSVAKQITVQLHAQKRWQCNTSYSDQQERGADGGDRLDSLTQHYLCI